MPKKNLGSGFKANWKHILVGAVATVAVVMSSSALVKLNRQETTQDLGASAFRVAVVTDAGKLDTSAKTAIVSEMYEYDGSKVVFDEDANFTWVMHLYDENKNYVSTSEEHTGDFEATQVEGVKYARWEGIPNADADGEISIFELPGYLSQFTITVNK